MQVSCKFQAHQYPSECRHVSYNFQVLDSAEEIYIIYYGATLHNAAPGCVESTKRCMHMDSISLSFSLPPQLSPSNFLRIPLLLEILIVEF